MKLVFEILWRDICRIAKNPIAVIVTIGVAILPSLYAWANIAANWDPYTSTSTMKVAVVNKDQGYDVKDMGYTNAGDMILDELSKNDQLKWTVMSEAEAKDTVNTGDAYAAFIIPEHFTEDIASILTNTPHKAHIQYLVNEKINAISPKVTDTGASTLESQISEHFVDLAGTTIGDKILHVASKTQDANAQNTQDVKSALDDLIADVKQGKDALSSTSTTIDSAKEAVGDVDGLIDSLSASAQSAADALDGIKPKTNELRDNAWFLSTKADAALVAAQTSITKSQVRVSGAVHKLSGSLQGITSSQADYIAQLQAGVDTQKDILSTLDGIVSKLPQNLQDRLSSTRQKLSDVIAKEQDIVSRARTLNTDVSTDIQDIDTLVSSSSDAIVEATGAAADGVKSFNASAMPEFISATDALGDSAADFAGVLRRTQDVARISKDASANVRATLENAQDLLAQAQDTLSQTESALSKLKTDLDISAETLNDSILQPILALDTEHIASVLSKPIELVDDPVYPVANYGSGVAPFYTNLALWVGGFVLIAIYKLEVKLDGLKSNPKLADVRAWQLYVARGLFLGAISIAQALICALGDLKLGIQANDPVTFVLTAVFASLVYLTIIYSMSLTFKHIGKGICVLLVILQIPGAGGMYPMEMMPDFFQALHPWLPFTYSIDAMREALFGYYALNYWFNMKMLALFVVPALILGLGLRPYIANVNAMFDKRLLDSGIFIGERDRSPQAQVLMLEDVSSYSVSERGRKKIERFMKHLPGRRLRLTVALFVVPLTIFIVMCAAENKLDWFALWIIVMVVIMWLVIWNEYAYFSLVERREERREAMIDSELARETAAKRAEASAKEGE